LLVERDERQFSADFVFPEQPSAVGIGSLILGSQALAGLVSATLGVLLVLLRGRRDRAAAMLGVLLQFLGFTTGGFGYVWAPSPAVFRTSELLRIFASAGLCIFLPLAGLEISGGPRNSKERQLVRAPAAFFGIAAASPLLEWAMLARLPSVAGAATWFFLAALLCLVCIARNYSRNDAIARNRINIVLLAFAAYIVSLVLFFWFVMTQGSDRAWAIIASVVIGLTGPALIAYAMLRGRLFDFKFVLNRTLVYATVSFILLAAFGLAEWGVERLHLIPEEWHRGNSLASGAIALALFLSFHRLRDWVEKHLERLLFHGWHVNEAKLRRFIASAAHYDQSLALVRNFAVEAGCFAQGAPVAIYLRGPGGDGYALQAGTLPHAEPAYLGDDNAIALMRAERAPVELVEAGSVLPGALALPMLDQSALAGFVLVAPRPDGARYRPDEVELLGWATQQVALDLQAMRARELAARVTDLERVVATLTEDKAQLLGVLGRSEVGRVA
jgi:hypothetical protein